MLSHHLIQAPSALNGKLFQLILLNIERDAVTWKHRFSTQTLMKYGLLRKYFIRISSIEHSAMMIPELQRRFYKDVGGGPLDFGFMN